MQLIGPGTWAWLPGEVAGHAAVGDLDPDLDGEGAVAEAVGIGEVLGGEDAVRDPRERVPAEPLAALEDGAHGCPDGARRRSGRTSRAGAVPRPPGRRPARSGRRAPCRAGGCWRRGWRGCPRPACRRDTRARTGAAGPRRRRPASRRSTTPGPCRRPRSSDLWPRRTRSIRLSLKTGRTKATSDRCVPPPAYGSLAMITSPGSSSLCRAIVSLIASPSGPRNPAMPLPWETSSPSASEMPTPKSSTS